METADKNSPFSVVNVTGSEDTPHKGVILTETKSSQVTRK